MKRIILLAILISNVVLADRPYPDSDYVNPIFFGDQIIGQNGTKWLPRSKYVKIKLTGAVTELFNRGCYVKLKSGQKEYLDFIKLDKKERQVFKTSYRCEYYKRPEITCEEDKQEVVFKAKGKKRLNACNVIK